MKVHEHLFQVLKNVLKKEVTAKNKFVLIILAYEKFLGSKKIQGGGALKRLIKKNEVALSREITALGLSDIVNEKEVEVYKYGRVNTLKSDLDKVQTQLIEEGFSHVEPPSFVPLEENQK